MAVVINDLASSELVTVYAQHDMPDVATGGHKRGQAVRTRRDNAKTLIRHGYGWHPPEQLAKAGRGAATAPSGRKEKASPSHELADLDLRKKEIVAKLEAAGLINRQVILSRTAPEIAKEAGIGENIALAILAKAQATWGPLPEDDGLGDDSEEGGESENGDAEAEG